MKRAGETVDKFISNGKFQVPKEMIKIKLQKQWIRRKNIRVYSVMPLASSGWRKSYKRQRRRPILKGEENILHYTTHMQSN